MDFADHDFEFTSLTDGRWLLTNPSRGYAFKINEYTMLLVRSLRGRRCWSEAYESYRSDTSTELTLESYESEVTEILKRIKQGAKPLRKKLTIGFTLLRHRPFSKIANHCTWLIDASVLATSIAALPIMIALLVLDPHTAHAQIGGHAALIIFMITTASFLAHELGHGAALRAHGQSTGNLGVGIYLVYPVFFIEIFAHEALSGVEKLWVNISGAHFQVLFGSAIATFALTVGSPLLAQTAEWVYILAFAQLIPLNKSDGYWLAHDLLASKGKEKTLGKLTLVCNLIAIPILAFVIYNVLYNMLWPLFFQLYWTHSLQGLSKLMTLSVLITALQVAVVLLLIVRSIVRAHSRKRRVTMP